jgi:hypothetical protein
VVAVEVFAVKVRPRGCLILRIRKGAYCAVGHPPPADRNEVGSLLPNPDVPRLLLGHARGKGAEENTYH